MFICRAVVLGSAFLAAMLLPVCVCVWCSCKRDLLQCLLLQCQKRPTTVSKETYYSVKRDLLQCVYACDALAHVCMRNLSLSLSLTHTHTPSRVWRSTEINTLCMSRLCAVCVCVRARACACMNGFVCVRASVRVRVRVRVCVCVRARARGCICLCVCTPDPRFLRLIGLFVYLFTAVSWSKILHLIELFYLFL